MILWFIKKLKEDEPKEVIALTTSFLFAQLTFLGLGWIIGTFTLTGIRNFTMSPSDLVNITLSLIPYYAIVAIGTDIYDSLELPSWWEKKVSWPVIMLGLILFFLVIYRLILFGYINSINVASTFVSKVISDPTGTPVALAIWLASLALVVILEKLRKKNRHPINDRVWRITLIGVILLVTLLTTILDARLQIIAIEVHALHNCGNHIANDEITVRSTLPLDTVSMAQRDANGVWTTHHITFITRFETKYLFLYTDPRTCGQRMILADTDDVISIVTDLGS